MCAPKHVSEKFHELLAGIEYRLEEAIEIGKSKDVKNFAIAYRELQKAELEMEAAWSK